MKFMTLGLLFSFPTYACWLLQGEVKINHTQIKINQKVSLGKVYSFSQHDYLLNISLPMAGKDFIQYEVLKRSSNELTPLSTGDLLLAKNQKMIATSADKDKKVLTTISLKLIEI